MTVAITPLIEVYWRICILLLFMIGVNPYNNYALLYVAPTYFDIYIFPYLGYWIEASILLLVFICFFVTQ